MGRSYIGPESTVWWAHEYEWAEWLASEERYDYRMDIRDWEGCEYEREWRAARFYGEHRAEMPITTAPMPTYPPLNPVGRSREGR